MERGENIWALIPVCIAAKRRGARGSHISFHPTVDSGGTLVTSALLELIIPPSPNVFVLLVKN